MPATADPYGKGVSRAGRHLRARGGHGDGVAAGARRRGRWRGLTRAGVPPLEAATEAGPVEEGLAEREDEASPVPDRGSLFGTPNGANTV